MAWPGLSGIDDDDVREGGCARLWCSWFVAVYQAQCDLSRCYAITDSVFQSREFLKREHLRLRAVQVLHQYTNKANKTFKFALS